MSDLATPSLIAAAETLSLPTDGSATSDPVNAAIAWAKRHSRTRLVLPEAPITAYAPIDLVSDVELIGTGVPCADPTKWGGGTMISLPLNARTPAVQALGTNAAEGSGGMIERVRLRNVSVFGPLQAWEAIARAGQAALIDIGDVAYLLLEDVWTGQDYRRALRMSEVWDSDIVRLTVTGGAGLSDPIATLDDPVVLAYTGRATLPIERALGFSLGVAAIEIVSPTGRGGNASNSIDFWGLRMESNASNGVGVLISGSDTNAIRFYGAKVELMEGCAPVLAVDGAFDVRFDGELGGGSTGSPYQSVGNVPAGTPWADYTQSALAVFSGCTAPRVAGTVYRANGGGRSDALLRFIGCSNPGVDVVVSDGLTHVNTARMVFDGCADVSVARTSCYAPPYLLAAPGACATERLNLNGTTTLS